VNDDNFDTAEPRVAVSESNTSSGVFARLGHLVPLRLPEGTWARRGIALLAGLLIAFAMPPWGWWPLAPIGIALWGLLLDSPSVRNRSMLSAIVAWGWFLPSELWMIKFTPIGWPVGVIVWYGFLAAITGALVPPTHWRFLALAAAITLGEWVRWHAPFGGVPMSMLAMTQARGPMLPIARVVGSLGVSAAVAVAGAALGLLMIRRVVTAAIVFGVVVGGAAFGVVAPSGHSTSTLSVIAIQGGGKQEIRASNADVAAVFQRHLDLANTVTEHVDLVVWPENVVNVTNFSGSAADAQLSALAKRLTTTLVVGVVEDQGDPSRFYNAAVVIGPDGRQIGRYDKVRRVPFGEYMPMRGLLESLAESTVGKDTIPKRDAFIGTQPNVIQSPAGRLGMLISWEVFFGRRARSAVDDGAELLLNPTNGSSYWLTQVQTQQVASSVLRAVESGRWLVQAAPTGFSEIVDPAGNVSDQSDIGPPAIVRGIVELRDGSTIAARVGDWPALTVMSALLVLSWAVRPRPKGKIPELRHGQGKP